MDQLIFYWILCIIQWLALCVGVYLMMHAAVWGFMDARKRRGAD